MLNKRKQEYDENISQFKAYVEKEFKQRILDIAEKMQTEEAKIAEEERKMREEQRKRE